MSENRLYHSVAAKIRALIDTGEFPVGSRLPGERELAERFGVSRVTVREAEIALEAQGRIVIKIGSGVYVKPRLASDEGALPDVSAFELTAARAVIEAEAAALAASHITDAELDELRGMIQALSAPGLSDAAAAEYDRAFHLAIARISGNPVVAHCVQLIWRMRNELPRVRECTRGSATTTAPPAWTNTPPSCRHCSNATRWRRARPCATTSSACSNPCWKRPKAMHWRKYADAPSRTVRTSWRPHAPECM